MSNDKKYKELSNSIRNAKGPQEKLDQVAIMLLTMATNDLDCIYKHIKRLWMGIGAILLAIIFSDQISLETIIKFFIKICS